MKSLNKTATAIAISLVLGAATIAYAQPGQMHGKMEHGTQAGMQHDMKGKMHKGMSHDGDKHVQFDGFARRFGHGFGHDHHGGGRCAAHEYVGFGRQFGDGWQWFDQNW